MIAMCMRRVGRQVFGERGEKPSANLHPPFTTSNSLLSSPLYHFFDEFVLPEQKNYKRQHNRLVREVGGLQISIVPDVFLRLQSILLEQGLAVPAPANPTSLLPSKDSS